MPHALTRLSLVIISYYRTAIAIVEAEITEQLRGGKVIAFKKKRRQGYARKKGKTCEGCLSIEISTYIVSKVIGRR